MSASPLDSNHLAVDPLLRARLGELAPAAAVGGFVEYMRWLDQPDAATHVWAYYGGDRLDETSPHQAILRQSWEVVIASTPALVAGGADLSGHGALMSILIRGLAGHVLVGGIKPMKREQDPDAMRYGNGAVISTLAFSIPIEMR